eukprot:6483160-Amphidinium_carterae.1
MRKGRLQESTYNFNNMSRHHCVVKGRAQLGSQTFVVLTSCWKGQANGTQHAEAFKVELVGYPT